MHVQSAAAGRSFHEELKPGSAGQRYIHDLPADIFGFRITDMNELLTFHEAARLAKVSPETIKYWVKTGRIKGEVVGRSKKGTRTYKRVRRQDLLDSLTDKKLQRLEEELQTRLLSVKQVEREFGVTKNTAYAIQRKLKVKKYQIHNDRNFFMDYHELVEKMAADDYYQYFLEPHLREKKRLACGCVYCYS